MHLLFGWEKLHPPALFAFTAYNSSSTQENKRMVPRSAWTLDFTRNLPSAAAGLAVLAVAVTLGCAMVPRVDAQSEQSTVAPSPSFEVASIKPNKSDGRPQGLRVERGGRLTAVNVPVRLLIAPAYRLTPTQIRLISGAPDWIDSLHFDLDARAEGSFSEDDLVLMEQALLADRFKLKAHFETRELPIYALVLAKAGKTGPRLVPHKDDTNCLQDPRGGGDPLSPNSVIPGAPCGGIRLLKVGGRMAVGASTTIDILARTLSGLVGRAVEDHTGLSGEFDIALEYTPDVTQPITRDGVDVMSPASSDAPSIFTALQEQLGLKLESRTGSVDILVIDHIEQPSGN
jgi:uncharacterized protein (TIGR03435 family)